MEPSQKEKTKKLIDSIDASMRAEKEKCPVNLDAPQRYSTLLAVGCSAECRRAS